MYIKQLENGIIIPILYCILILQLLGSEPSHYIWVQSGKRSRISEGILSKSLNNEGEQGTH